MPSMPSSWGSGAKPTLPSWRAKQEGRTVITVDLDYPRLLTLAQATEPSVILFREGDWSDAAVIGRMGEVLVGEVLAALTEADVTGSILVVDHFRVRRRRLPIGG